MEISCLQSPGRDFAAYQSFPKLWYAAKSDTLDIMKNHTLCLVATAVALVAPLRAQEAALPGFDSPAKWYNTPPLLEVDLKQKAVLFEVFRTW